MISLSSYCIAIFLSLLAAGDATKNSPVQGYQAFLHIVRDTSNVIVQESFKAIPFQGRIWRDMMFECKAQNLSAFIDDKPAAFQFHEANTLPDLPEGYSRISILGQAGTALVNVRLEYVLVDSVLATSGQKGFAVLVGLPACSRSFCAAYSKIDVNLFVPGEVSHVKGHLHLPRDMFKSVPLSGAMVAPNPVVQHFTHKDGSGFPIERISVTTPKDGDENISPHSPFPLAATGGNPSSQPDVITVVVEFETSKPNFHVGLLPCYPSQYFSSVLDDSPAGGADLMLELGATIAILCAGLPCLCGLGCWFWVRCVKKIPEPKFRGTGIASFSYGKDGQNIYDTVNVDNELTVAAHLKHDPSWTPQTTCRDYD